MVTTLSMLLYLSSSLTTYAADLLVAPKGHIARWKAATVNTLGVLPAGELDDWLEEQVDGSVLIRKRSLTKGTGHPIRYSPSLLLAEIGTLPYV